MDLLLILLKSYGFQWLRDGSIADCIEPEAIDVIDCNGDTITVYFTDLYSTTAKVVKIEFPPPGLLEDRRIILHVEDIDGDQIPAFNYPKIDSGSPKKEEIYS